MTQKFIYFDLGKVLIDFSHERMYQQMGRAAEMDPQKVREVLSSGLQLQYEKGLLGSRTAYELFCQLTGTHPDYRAFSVACNDIFTPIDSMLPIVAQLHQAGYRLGILSNTSEGHWQHCYMRYGILREFFCVYALSFEIGEVKPDAGIFRKAAELAQCEPHEIFFTDDIPGHVAGAKGVGFDAVVYESTAQIVREFQNRGVAFNY